MTADSTGAADDASDQETGGRHAAKDGDERHPLIDLDRDPTPGVADHAAPDAPDAE